MWTVGLTTLGCKVSQYETEAISEAFSDLGFSVKPFDTECDVYVINTCTVTAEADAKSRKMIRRAHRLAPSALIFVIGCYAQVAPEELLSLDGVVYVSGTNQKMKVPETALRMLREGNPETAQNAVTTLTGAGFEPMCVRGSPRTRAVVKVEDGCECRCTYCAIPGARGDVRSKKPEDVLREVAALVGNGVREVVITGIETASYGADLDAFRLIDLLELLDRESGAERIRLGSLTPEVMTPAFVSRLACLTHVAPHFHLSMQSGSDGVLARMRRRYRAGRALDAVRLLRDAIPHVQFTADMMVGFVGETDAEFEETLSFVREIRFLHMHVFAYSRRRGTPAYDMKDRVPEEVKHARSACLIALGEKISAALRSERVASGRPMRVIPETFRDGVWYGHSDSFFDVAVRSDAPLAGQIVQVQPTGVQGAMIFGQIIQDGLADGR